MSEFSFETISEKDGSWQALCADWKNQCEEAGECYEDYAPDSFGVLSKIADGSLVHADGPGTVTAAATLKHVESGQYYLACMLNLARLPRTDGMTLRVRHLLVSPSLDFGQASLKLYSQVLVHTLMGVVNTSESSMGANNIRFHLRSPNDAEFFAAVGAALDGEKIFRSVEMKGSWLYITKV
ncbi:hypothetical protein [Novosphingobium sp. AP12]|uniref:hypothetical protein n=1 Tax=Novosphingobium sp. AP12 TaxID=1144305 RepID=UPI0002721A32|nr:hypothetical protein [Novosphingobium sp. AP12]EJL23696.1 hypothetical protein PMI02_04039 [Novosphingobium sp. AP12]